MYLTKLDIVGFKSFAQKTSLEFKEGLTAIVGPNGCGKTNIVDAIRWVLGEQKTSVLRSDVMENVIFNGSSSRKSLGMAEVSIQIENNKRILPTEFTQVTVTRRLFRDGESNYLINNTTCRLKDIVDMFMDTGMGSDSYSVIELKMVEAILSGKPEERRHLLEEAAGITKYKLRRKEAGKKLVFVQNDLVRIQDIVQEIEKNVNSLARQASKTKRYNKLTEELKILETELFKHEFYDYQEQIKKLKTTLENLKKDKEKSEVEINEADEYIKNLETSYFKLDNELREAINKENSINSEIALKNKETAVTREKISSLNTNIEKINNRIKDNNQLILNLTADIKEKSEKSDIHKNSLTEKKSSLKDIIKQKEEALIDVESAQEKFNQREKDVSALENSISSLKTSATKSKTRKSSLEQRLEQSEIETYKLERNIKEAEQEEKNLIKKIEKLKTNLKDAETDLAQTKDKQDNLQLNINNLQNDLSNKKIELNKAVSTMEFLTGLNIDDESVKFLLQSDEWLGTNQKITLAEAVGADENLRIAIESALGDSANLIIVTSNKEAETGIEILKKHSKGKAAFICKNLIPNFNPPEKIEKIPGVIGWVSELARCDDDIRNALRGILAKTLIVDKKETALGILSKKLADCCVTPSGEIFKSTGIIKGGGQSKLEGMSVGKIERIANLKTAIKELEEEIKALETTLKSKREEYLAINLKEKNDKLKNAESEFSSNEQKIALLQYKKESLLKNLEVLRENTNRFKQEISEIENEEGDFTEQTGKLEDKLKNAVISRDEALNELKLLREIANERIENSKNAELEVIKLESEIKGLEKDITNNKTRIDEIKDEIEKLNSEIQTSKETIQALLEKITTTDEDTTTLLLQAEQASNEKDVLEDRKKSIEEQISQQSKDLANRRKQYESSLENIHNMDIKLNGLETECKSLVNRAKEMYEIELSEIEQEQTADFSLSENRAAAKDLREKLMALGSVNFMALDEFEAQTKRLEFYQSQIKDLTESEKTLLETITEINKTAENKFITTFNDVNKNFKNLFKTLFSSEGEAELKLIGDNILESDIEIMATPPGKKPHSIELLSGGEKTLTAIALLFSIYLVKPSPFCILDEVDAPLDDANIDRFISMLRQFSENTQFLIVTHNKRTMEAADTLYGVTMQEEGVSKVVSVKFN